MNNYVLKLLLIGLRNGQNLGDVVINECTKYLVHKALEKYGVVNECTVLELDMEKEEYDIVDKVDCIVFVGGGIVKFKYQKFYEYIDKITCIADKNNIPVYFHAVGVEGYDSEDDKCKLLKKALNRDCVKQITVRENHDILTSNYITNSNINTATVSDSAVWSPETFNINKKQGTCIGLGMIREGIFRSNGIDIGFEELLQFWSDIIHELSIRGLPFKLFTTGWPSDMKFIDNFFKAVKWDEDKYNELVISVSSPEELVSTISKFRGVIAGRLHANIISYSLDIPSVGLVWNDKLKRWGENIMYPERFFSYKQWEAEKVVDTLVKGIEQGYTRVDYSSFRNTSMKSIEDIIVSMIVKKI